jgi:predicted NAD/FAD-binding protein
VSGRYRFAVVGAGAAGLSAAYVLSREHEVTIFEREALLGGHVRTFVVPSGPDAGTALDAGFTVLNDRTYPTMHRLMAALGIDGIEAADMSFGYASPRDGIQYAINSGVPVLSDGAKPALGELLREALRFWRTAGRELRDGALAGMTLGEFVTDRGFPRSIIDHYLAPFGALAWLMPGEAMLAFPADMFIGFFEHHGLTSLSGGLQWQYIRGGSRRWVDAFERCFPGRIERSVEGLLIRRDDTGIEIEAVSRPSERFDFVVLATHADEALRALADPSAGERRLLGSFAYRPARAVLHTDPSVMPPDPTMWAAWNAAREDGGMSATFYLNRLERLVAVKNHYFVTLYRAAPIAGGHVLNEIDFIHPQYTVSAFQAQSGLAALNGIRRTFYCGSYHGYSGHEDAIRSGVAVGEAFGLTL